MPKYLVECISQFKMSYIIDAKEEEHALDTVVCEDIDEFTQVYLGQQILSSREVSDDEIVRIFKKEEQLNFSREDILKRVKMVDYGD